MKITIEISEEALKHFRFIIERVYMSLLIVMWLVRIILTIITLWQG